MQDPDKQPDGRKAQSPKSEDKTTDNNQVSLTDRPTEEQAKTAVATNNKRTLTTAQAAVVKMQNEAIKFITQKLGEQRAREFATHIALMARDNFKLSLAIQNNPESFLSALMASAERDLMPNTSKGLAYLIPYGD